MGERYFPQNAKMKRQSIFFFYLQKLVFISFVMGLGSCSLFKSVPQIKSRTASPFFENISVRLEPGQKPAVQVDQSQNQNMEIQDEPVINYINSMPGIEYVPPVVFRYAVLLDIELPPIL